MPGTCTYTYIKQSLAFWYWNKSVEIQQNHDVATSNCKRIVCALWQTLDNDKGIL